MTRKLTLYRTHILIGHEHIKIHIHYDVYIMAYITIFLKTDQGGRGKFYIQTKDGLFKVSGNDSSGTIFATE